MVKLVSDTEFKEALWITFTDDDNLVDACIKAASGAVIDYLGARAVELLDLDSGGELQSSSVVPDQVKQATIQWGRVFFEAGQGEQGKVPMAGDPPYIVDSLLYRLRTPTLA